MHVWRGMGRSVISLSRGCVACWLHLVSTLVTSRSVFYGLPQSSMPLQSRGQPEQNPSFWGNHTLNYTRVIQRGLRGCRLDWLRTPQFCLLQEHSTEVVQVCCRTVIWGRRAGHVLVYLFFTLWLPSTETPHLYISKPHSVARGHNSTRTAIIFVCVDSFIQALAAKHRMLTLLPITRSHARDVHITDLVTASAAIILAGSSSRSLYLTLAV